MTASDFSLPDQAGRMHTLSQYRGQWVVLYFYPKDDTPGCTKEACNFRDSFRELQKFKVVILGVSGDSVESHKKFAAKYHLNFPILSDPKSEVIALYHAKKTYRDRSHVLSHRPSGEIAKVYPKVNPLTHAGEIIRDLETTLSG